MRQVTSSQRPTLNCWGKSDPHFWVLNCWLRPGFMRALTLILKLRPHGLIHAGPPCSSFVYINAYTHGRTRSKPFGNCSLREYVKQANQLLAGQPLNSLLHACFRPLNKPVELNSISG